MGKKIAMEKIENPLRRQVTFSKRRNSLIKKANEISILCDVDVAFIAFSPSGRIIKFSSRPRFEDMIECYIKLPAVKRHERNPYKELLANWVPSPGTDQRDQMETQGQGAVSYYSGGGGDVLNYDKILRQLDPWISPYSPKVREKLLEDMIKEAKGKSVVHEVAAMSSKNNTCSLNMLAFPSTYTSVVPPIQNHRNWHIGGASTSYFEAPNDVHCFNFNSNIPQNLNVHDATEGEKGNNALGTAREQEEALGTAGDSFNLEFGHSSVISTYGS
ncbi:hypothetical protein GH714_036526 [Hevea brasiliensis]|uniref:MADS-box domain-containing protein n=1 Tax=Hevea brasiliensis TaxID=3981 RepID=A0A6A6KYD4_HEVBR|nr:hypothetical protein GH714_036526 [Hevea brasiliensis]